MNSDFRDLLRIFNDHRVKYLVVGAYAFMKHAEPRYTKDLDLWVKAGRTNAVRVFQALREFGAPLRGLTENDFSKEGFFYQIGVEPTRIDILMSIPGLDFDKAWENRVEANLGGTKAVILSKDDLITSKRASGRPQDFVDIQTLTTPRKKSITKPRQKRHT